MSKTFRFVLVAALAVALIAPLSIAQDKGAGEKMPKDVYFTMNQNPGNIPPADADTLGAPANPPWTRASDTLPIPLEFCDTLWIGCMNTEVLEQWKEWWIDLRGSNVFKLHAVYAEGHHPDGSTTGFSYSEPIGKDAVPGGVIFHVKIIPQPEWEVMALHARATLTINTATAQTVCHRDEMIPSLTPYGIIVLVLLLLASTVWVIRKKRAAVPA